GECGNISFFRRSMSWELNLGHVSVAFFWVRQSMPRQYSNDFRARIIEAIEAGASRREAADHSEPSPRVVVLWPSAGKKLAALQRSQVAAVLRRLRGMPNFCWD